MAPGQQAVPPGLARLIHELVVSGHLGGTEGGLCYVFGVQLAIGWSRMAPAGMTGLSCMSFMLQQASLALGQATEAWFPMDRNTQHLLMSRFRDAPAMHYIPWAKSGHKTSPNSRVWK